MSYSAPRPHPAAIIYGLNRFIYIVTSVIVLGGLTACVSTSPVPTPTVSLMTTPQAPPTPIAWQTAAEPITLDNIDQIRLLGRLEAPSTTPSSIFSYALSPDNTQLVTLSNVFIAGYDLVSGQMTFSTSTESETRVYYSPDKDEIYTIHGDGGVFVLNSADGGEKTFLNTFPEAQAAYAGMSDYYADEGWLALGAFNGEIKVWDVPQRVSLVTLSGTGQTITALRFSPDGSHLAAAYLDGKVEVWDWRNRAVAYTPEIPSSEQQTIVDQLRFTSDGGQLIGMTPSFGIVWDATSGLRRSVMTTGEGAANHVVKVAPKQDLILIGGTGANISFWDTDTGQMASSLAGFGGDFPLDAAFSPDGKLLFTSQLNTDVALWSLENLAQGSIGRSNAIFENKNILNLEWTNDGFLVLMFDSRGTIDVWGIS